MATGRSGTKAGARHIAPLVRGSFFQAIEQLKKAGTITSMADIWQDILATDPARAIELLSRFVPKEMLVEVDDARPFAFTSEPLTPGQWLIKHEPKADDEVIIQ